MASHRPSLRVSAPSLLLALVLVGGSVPPAIARDAALGQGSADGSRNLRSAAQPHVVEAPTDTATTMSEQTDLAVEVRPATPDLPVAKPVAVSRSEGTTPRVKAHTATTAPAGYHGRNHVWIPSLGVNRSVSFFSCSSNAYPGNRVYRWGCAGSNNIYLFGHASSVFAPLHHAYVTGHLRKGMAVFYAGNDGVVHRYTVRWWKVTTPDKGAWAYASQGTPSLTLQTCLGAQSQYRLIVRLVRAD